MGIQKRLVGSYLAVILVTVAILEGLAISFVKFYYDRNVERILINQAQISASFFHQYFADQDLEKQSERLLSGFAENSSAQVQIIGPSGRLLQDSAGQPPGKDMNGYEDVRQAMSGTSSIWRGPEPLTKEPVMAVSYPLKAGEKTVGLVRFVTSMTETNKTVQYIASVYISSGFVVIVIVAVLGLWLSRTITSSITELKRAAERMAEGDFSVRAKKRYRDELGTLADTLNTMAEKVKQNERLKSEFISSVSHEIRTPLTSIKGWVVTLKSSLEDRLLLEDGFDVIEEETDRLTRLVDELLDFSKLDNGRIELRRTSFPLPELLRHVAKQLMPRADRQGIKLQVEADVPVPNIFADPSRLKQVLINLVDNALKFTDKGGSITLAVRPDRGKAVIAVTDTGVGITEYELGKIFQKFYKGSGQAAGSGLGLSISEEIVKLHGGELTVQSQVGKGTRVEIVLPLEANEQV
ncbi:HAMP domain-containing sensor histidine kinase [Paenibacillus filicis]|uniref:histidine kinase n=1 Tax=Paenibacillus gyeongsangnamensis TaxID=3388067 RepID=A0ABT4Q4L1_9BACL|nr:HAMP domain-containing sensor histidine kinase [Paenibacillus filicis]MCZ8511802.1 HAMP domain-containing sensor histidine kinase [Paenibacillus filicis]